MIKVFDSKQWAKNHATRMATCLRELFTRDVLQKQKSYKKSRDIYDKIAPEDDGNIPIGAHVLIHFPQAQGSTKLMSNWKGTYLVLNKVDKNVYLVSHVDGQRRKMLIHKNRMRVLPQDQDGNLVKSDSSEAVAKNEMEFQKSGKSRSNEHPTEVKQTRDQSDTIQAEPKKKKENQKAPSKHKMELRSRKKLT